MRTQRARLLRSAVLMMLCMALLPIYGAGAATSKHSVTVSFGVTTYQNRARSALKLINQSRAEAGLEPLKMLDDLEDVAIQRAAELFVLFDHDRPDLTDYATAYAGYDSLLGATAVAECIAAGYTKAEEAVADWQTNAADTLLDPDFTHAGVACVYVKGSYNGYYWALYLQAQPADLAAKEAAATVKAGRGKTIRVDIASGMYARADNSHKRFELRVNNLNLKGRQSAQPTVYLYDRYDVKIGKCELDDLTFKSSNKNVFTVLQSGTVKRQRAGTATLTVSAPGLDAATCTVTVGSGSSSRSSSGAVTASTIADSKPSLTAASYSDHVSLSVYLKGSSGYVLYRSTSRSGSYTKVDEKATTKRWTLKLDHDDISRTYYYKVRAYKNQNGRRVYSEYSTPVRVSP